MALAAQITRRSTRARSRPTAVVSVGPFPLGLNTVQAANELADGEASALLNMKLNPMGGLETRAGLSRYTAAALTNPPVYIANFPLLGEATGAFGLFTDTSDVEWEPTSSVEWVVEYPSSTESDELIVTKSDNKLYYLDGTRTPVLAGTLLGEATILPFGNYALLLDGSYVKYWDRANGVIKLCYDDGTGSRGYQHSGLGLTADTGIALYNGGNTKAGVRFVTQSWDNGYTIPVTTVEIYMKSSGSPTGDIGCEIYTDAGALVATSDTTVDSSTLGATAEKLSFSFSSGDLDPSTAYWAVATYSSGDSSNYVQVECENVGSNGDGKYYDGSWNDDTTKAVLAGVKPGRPPKAKFGIVSEGRVYLAGDGNNPGWVWYSNVGDCFDWSTSNGGGYVGAVDENANNFPVGAITAQYGEVYVFGQQDQPYLCKLTGDEPQDFSLPPVYQKISSTHKTCLNIINDIWFGSSDGVNNITGVLQYGDLRTFHESDPVKNLITSYWDNSEAFAGYFGDTGQYFLKLPNYLRVLVAHTKSPIREKTGRVRYPWVEYLFVGLGLTSDTYRWTASGSGTNEYYCELAGGGDPSLSEPAGLILGESVLTSGTLGSLSDHAWAYGDNDSLGYSTVYIRDDSGDPDTSGVTIRTVLEPTCFAAFSGRFYIGFDDGYVYYLDDDVVQDNGVDPPFCIGGKLHKALFTELCLNRFKLSLEAEAAGAGLTLDIFDEKVGIDSLHSSTPNVTADIDIDTATSGNINWNAEQFMAFIRNVSPNNAPVRFEKIDIDAAVLSK